MATATSPFTVQDALNEANPGRAWDAVRRAKLGDALRGLTKTLTGLTAASSFDLTSITDPDDATKSLPAALVIGSLRVTAGTAATGTRIVTDAAETAAQIGTTGIYLATLSDDGKTITFEADVTAFIINYIPKEDLTVDLEQSS